MRLPRGAREFERTCADCGYAWRVPRSAARRRRGISAYSHMPRGTYRVSDSEPEIATAEAVSEVDAAYRHCPGAVRIGTAATRPPMTREIQDVTHESHGVAPGRIVDRVMFLTCHQR